MIETKMDEILNELGDGSYILVGKIKNNGDISSVTKWKSLSELLVISILEKTKHDLLSEINRKQTMVKDGKDIGGW